MRNPLYLILLAAGLVLPLHMHAQPDLIYDSTDGSLTISTAGNEVIWGFNLSGPLFDFDQLSRVSPDFLFQTIQLSDEEVQGYALLDEYQGSFDLGPILPPGLNEAEVLGTLRKANYAARRGWNPRLLELQYTPAVPSTPIPPELLFSEGNYIYSAARAGAGRNEYLYAGERERPIRLGFDPVEQYVYWHEIITSDLHLLLRQKLGSNVQETVLTMDETSPIRDLGDFAIDPVNRKLYIVSANLVSSTDMDGNNFTEIATGLIFDRKSNIDVDPAKNKLYWATDSLVTSADLDGSNRDTVFRSASGGRIGDIALDPSTGTLFASAFFDSNANQDSNQIYAVNLNEMSFIDSEIIATGFGDPRTMLFDPVSGKVYWATLQTDRVHSRIMRANPDGTDAEAVVGFVDSPEGIVIIPEPGSLVSLVIGASLLFRRRRG